MLKMSSVNRGKVFNLLVLSISLELFFFTIDHQIHTAVIVCLEICFFFFPENGFYGQKVKKKWKSKNGVKTALTPLFKELWAIHVFFTNLKFDDCQKHERKRAKVKKLWRIEF